MSELQPQFDATYFRTHGIHSVENGDSTDHLVSFPTWHETEVALKSDLPSNGTIITPEYATTDELSPENLEDSAALINDRVDFIKDLSTATDATFVLGSAHKTYTQSTMTIPSREVWRNAALHIRKGKVESIDLKHFLLPVEEKWGITPADRQYRRTVRNGRAVLICADLYAQSFEQDQIFKLSARDIIAPLEWATPMNNETRFGAEREDYYRGQLEETVSRYALKDMPYVRRITTVDKGLPDLPPYNAVFTRKN